MAVGRIKGTVLFIFLSIITCLRLREISTVLEYTKMTPLIKNIVVVGGSYVGRVSLTRRRNDSALAWIAVSC